MDNTENVPAPIEALSAHTRKCATQAPLASRGVWVLGRGSLSYHNYCDTGHPLTMVILEEP